MNFSVIHMLLKPPVFENKNETFWASLLHTVLLMLVVVSMVSGFIAYRIPENRLFILILVPTVCLGCGTVYWIFHRGRVTLARWLFVFLFWGAITAVVWFSDGVQSQVLPSYITLVVMAGLLLGGRVALAFAVVVIAVNGGFVYAAHADLLPIPDIIREPISLWVVISVNLIIVATLLSLAHQEIVLMMKRLRQSKQAEANQQFVITQLQEEVEKQKQELEATQERLIRQEKLALMGQLAGSIGHELRNPLGVIANSVYYLNLRLTDADEKTQEYLDMITVTVDEARRIITDLLSLLRTSPGKRQAVTISMLVAHVLERQNPPENVQLYTIFPENLPDWYIDGQQIKQVLINLLDNAYQSIEGKGEVHIYAEAQEGTVHLSIRDSGSGMPDEMIPRIFEPLFTTKADGVGLGLMICKNLVEVNGGTILVDSSEGEGSTFTVVLPTKEVAHAT